MTGRTILIVDPSAEARDVYRTILEWAGYRVLEAASGPAGIRAAQLEEIDVIATELLLPGLDGLQMIRALKADPRTAAIPILVVSVVVEPREMAEALRIGCSGYFQKPCSPARLLAEVERVTAAAIR